VKGWSLDSYNKHRRQRKRGWNLESLDKRKNYIYNLGLGKEKECWPWIEIKK
jgi:hypothetical protein